jgi:hypothetical protein
MSICGDLINSAHKNGTFPNRIITGDETWCFLYDLQQATIGHLEIVIITKKEETVTGQVKKAR